MAKKLDIEEIDEVEEIDVEDLEEEQELDSDGETKSKSSKKDKNAKTKSQVSKSFSDAIKTYLDEFAAANPLFAEKYKNQKKSIDECCNFIVGEVKKMKVQGLSDEEVYYLARHYYEEENLKVSSLPSGTKVVVNHHAELSEEEKKAAHDKAVKDFEAAELKKLQNAKKKTGNKQSTQNEKSGAEQLSFFDLLDGGSNA